MSLAEPKQRDLHSAATSHRGDRIFNRTVTALAFTALVVLAGIAIFLGYSAVDALRTQGLDFLFTTEWTIGEDPKAASRACCTALCSWPSSAW